MGPVKIKRNQRDSMIAPALHGIQTKKFPPTPMNRLPEANFSAQPLIWEQLGDWRVRMKTPAGVSHDFDLAPPREVRVQDEPAPLGLPEPNEKTDGWLRGLPLGGVRAEECTIPGALLPASLVVKESPGAAGAALVRGRDYDLDPEWGTVWRLEKGKAPAVRKVWFDYSHIPQRLDSAVWTATGEVDSLSHADGKWYQPSEPDRASNLGRESTGSLPQNPAMRPVLSPWAVAALCLVLSVGPGRGESSTPASTAKPGEGGTGPGPVFSDDDQDLQRAALRSPRDAIFVFGSTEVTQRGNTVEQAPGFLLKPNPTP
jgi:hypothetical protein